MQKTTTERRTSDSTQVDPGQMGSEALAGPDDLDDDVDAIADDDDEDEDEDDADLDDEEDEANR